MAKVTVLGAGGWGMALALVAHSKGHKVAIWSPFENEVKQLSATRTNPRLLAGIYLDKEIPVTDDISVAEGSDIIILAVPSVAVAETAARLRNIENIGVVVNVAKGFGKGGERLSEVIGAELPNARIVVLSGPSHAEEVARKLPTTVTVASKDVAAAMLVQQLLSTDNFRIYTNEDIIGVELGGALKNVIAVCSGICAGLGLGDNTRAALITRGLAEMTRLGIALGASEHTFLGLSGIGDLIVTCLSEHSRNNRFGLLVGGGMPIESALNEVGTVEGYYAAALAFKLAKENSLELPIIEQCYGILYNNESAASAVGRLTGRPPKTE